MKSTNEEGIPVAIVEGSEKRLTEYGYSRLLDFLKKEKSALNEASRHLHQGIHDPTK